MTTTIYPLQGLLSIVTIVCMWKMLSDRNEKGWKALIPFYSEYALAKTANEAKLGKKLAITKILAVIALSAFIVVFAVAATQGGGVTVSEDGTVVTQEKITIPDTMKTPLLIVGLLMFILLILMLVYQIKFESRFIKFNGAKPWILAVWIFVPVLAYVYFAFIHKNYDIPGVTEKEMYNI